MNDPRFDTMISIENYHLKTNADAEITGSNVVNILSSGSGDDIIYGLDGNDEIRSGSWC